MKTEKEFLTDLLKSAEGAVNKLHSNHYASALTSAEYMTSIIKERLNEEGGYFYKVTSTNAILPCEKPKRLHLYKTRIINRNNQDVTYYTHANKHELHYISCDREITAVTLPYARKA